VSALLLRFGVLPMSVTKSCLRSASFAHVARIAVAHWVRYLNALPWASSAATTQRLPQHIFQPPRLDRLDRSAALETAEPC